MSVLKEDDFKAGAEKALTGDIPGAIKSIAAAIVSVLTQHPVLGALGGAAAEAVAIAVLEAPATRRIREAVRNDKEITAKRAAIQELASELCATLAPFQVDIEEFDDRIRERLYQLLAHLEYNMASAADQKLLLAGQEALLAELQAMGARLACTWDASPRKLIAEHHGSVLSGPLTIGAVLGDSNERVPDAYPIGPYGIHFCFTHYNPNPADLIVLAIEVEVVSFRPVKLSRLEHGAGAEGTLRRFRTTVEPRAGNYRCYYLGGAHKIVEIPAGKTESFDIEVTTSAAGLFELRVHVRAEVGGESFNIAIGPAPTRVVFFDKNENCEVDRGLGGPLMPYSDYIQEMASYGGKGDVTCYG